VLFIDNASNDNTSQVIRSLWDSEIPMRIIREEKPGLVHARLRGIAEAKFEFVSFIDDDNWISTVWIREVYDFFMQHPSAGLVGSCNEAVFESSPPPWFREVQGNFAIGSQGDQTEDVTLERGYIWGAGMSMRKSAFERIRAAGFSPLLVGRKGKSLLAGEDTEICFAFSLAGWQIWYNESMKLQHFIPSGRFGTDYIRRMYRGFGQSRAIFPVYRAVLKNKSYRPFRQLIRALRQFLPYLAWKSMRSRRTGDVNIDALQYELHKYKLIFNLRNFFASREMYHRVRGLKHNLEKYLPAGTDKKTRP
jgi:glycosyltransferase involved in cell wall biosynthesis